MSLPAALGGGDVVRDSKRRGTGFLEAGSPAETGKSLAVGCRRGAEVKERPTALCSSSSVGEYTCYLHKQLTNHLLANHVGSSSCGCAAAPEEGARLRTEGGEPTATHGLQRSLECCALQFGDMLTGLPATTHTHTPRHEVSCAGLW